LHSESSETSELAHLDEALGDAVHVNQTEGQCFRLVIKVLFKEKRLVDTGEQKSGRVGWTWLSDI
jgi:hypothetical protein